MGGGMDDILYIGSVGNVNGNRNVAYLDHNDRKRNLNLNWFDNDWNDSYRFLAVRNYFHSSAVKRRKFVLLFSVDDTFFPTA